MKIEIINKPMLCWDNDEEEAQEQHVLAKVTECSSEYPFKAVSSGDGGGYSGGWRYAKPLPEEVELTVAEVSKLLGKKVKIVE